MFKQSNIRILDANGLSLSQRIHVKTQFGIESEEHIQRATVDNIWAPLTRRRTSIEGQLQSRLSTGDLPLPEVSSQPLREVSSQDSSQLDPQSEY